MTTAEQLAAAIAEAEQLGVAWAEQQQKEQAARRAYAAALVALTKARNAAMQEAA